MIQRYFDAAYLGKLHWMEPGAAEVTACAVSADELVCALHGGAEFYSIGHRKMREALATPAAVRAVFIQFLTDCASGQIRLLPLTESIIQRVESVFLTAPATFYLRAADALHLATAAEHGFTEIHSNDKHLLAAAPLFGLLGVNVIP